MRVALGSNPALVFDDPVEIWAPRDLDSALNALAEVDRALDAGYYVAGALSYELGALLAGIATEISTPLLLLGVFPEPVQRDTSDAAGMYRMGAPLPRIAKPAYAGQVRFVHQRIRDGEVYQVNYSVPFDVPFSGNAAGLYARLSRGANVAYSAFLEHAGISLVSLSPELFLKFEGDRISTKPMKGTAPLPDIDALACEKNRAEHLMIVDLLRNDLHRICNDVEVTKMFEVERYPTFATMTSTIGASLGGASFADVIRATFPCGSVTGAPKRAAMQHIAALERGPRGFYTGSIGYLSPQRHGWWNVAIRTLQFAQDRPMGRFDAGGGIVSDSTPEGEWDEVLLKARFLEPAYEEFSILEALRSGSPAGTIAAHVDRLASSAERFGWSVDGEDLRTRIHRFDALAEPHIIRIRSKRGGTTMHAEPCAALAEPVRVCASTRTVRSDDPLLVHKTSWRPVQDAAAREAAELNCFDAILGNERGEVTEGARTNLFVQLDGVLYTPPLACGLLPGILRSQLLARGLASERVLYPEDVRRAQALFVGNSARGLLRACLVTGADCARPQQDSLAERERFDEFDALAPGEQMTHRRRFTRKLDAK